MPVRLASSLALLIPFLAAGCGPDGGSGAGGGGEGGGCIDETYREAMPDSGAGISDLVSSYQPTDSVEFVMAVLARRYPVGRYLVAGAEPASHCVEAFLGGSAASADAVLRQLEVVVHECGHIFDNGQSRDGNAYQVTESLAFACKGGDSVARGGATFARSRIRHDAYSAARPPCSESGGDCDFYADVYLDGDPDDASFQGGDQGFNMLLEEELQYVNSLATGLAFTSELRSGGATSMRDGILTFLWYVERYLHMARLEHPDAYAHLATGDGGCWREAILTVWGRAFRYLDATASMDHLGLSDAKLQQLVETPALLDEIERLRVASGCR